MSDFAAVAVFLLMGTGFVLFNFLLARLIRPSAPNPIKQSTYECGEEAFGTAWIQFNIRFYIYCLIFVIFDVEMVFLLGDRLSVPGAFCLCGDADLCRNSALRSGLCLAQRHLEVVLA